MKYEMSPGELLDRIAILRVKIKKLGTKPGLVSELDGLLNGFDVKALDEDLDELEKLNLIGWENNEVIFTAAESSIPTDAQELERIVRAVFVAHDANMARVNLKNSINSRYGDSRMELKSWQ